MKTIKSKSKILRAGSYCRTSGKDKTSISIQKEANKKFINSQDNWIFVGHYIDEHKSGAKVVGRDDYQKAIKDLTNDKYDILVPYDISRYGRDGLDIIRDSEMLKRNFGKFVVDSKGQFDNRDHHKVMTNFVFAGMAEDERLRVMERVIRGRMKRAAEGKKWTNVVPFGRSWDEEKQIFVINENGRKLQKLLPRYTKGESLKRLALEFGFKSGQTITRAVRESQLSGTYYVIFNAKDIDIIKEKVAVPNMPEIITPALEKKVRNTMAFNKRQNKQHPKKYEIAGFARCAHCGKTLKPQLQTSGKNGNQILYYRHPYKTYYADDSDKQNKCQHFRCIRADVLRSASLDYLYNWFVDKPAFEQAVKNTMPDGDDRKALQQDIEQIKKQISKLDKDELKLVKAFDKGFQKTDVTLNEQSRIITQRKASINRLDELNQTLNNMPDFESIKDDAKLLRWSLLGKHWGKDWRKLSYDDIRRFLHFLFSNNPRKNHFGIFIGRENDKWVITFRGQVAFYHDIIDGEAEFLSELSQQEIDRLAVKMKDKRSVVQKAKKYQQIKDEADRLEKLIDEVETLNCNILPYQRNSSRT